MSNIGKVITDFYCGGFCGRRYDLRDSIIEAEGRDWIVVRTTGDESVHLNLKGHNKQEYVDNWTSLTKVNKIKPQSKIYKDGGDLLG